MKCCYAGIYRETIPLVTCSTENGNWDRVFLNMSEHGQIKDGIQIMNVNGYLWGIMKEREGLTFLIVNKNIDQKTTEESLQQLKSQFIRANLNWRGAEQLGLMPEYESKLSDFMRTVSTQGKMATIQSNLVDTTQNMTDTYEELLIRGRRIEDVTSLSDQLETNTTIYVEEARNLKFKLFFRKYKYHFLVGIVILIIFYLILALACGGFDLQPRCIKEEPKG